MQVRTQVHTTPTSQLIYYRVYPGESPFTKDSIDNELHSRKYISFGSHSERTLSWDQYIEENRGLQALSRQFISLEAEETKIINRGQGLEKFAFDRNVDFYTLFKIVLTSGIEAGYSKELTTLYNMPSILTWSERVLFYSISKQMLSIMKIRLRELIKEEQSIQRKVGITHDITPLLAFQRRMRDEQKLLDYLERALRYFKQNCVLSDMDKMPLNTPERNDMLTPIIFHPLLSTVVPTDYYETIWDRMILNLAISKEMRILFANEDDTLSRSINSLCDLSQNPIEEIKMHVIRPIIF